MRPVRARRAFSRARAWARTASHWPRSCSRILRRSSRLIVDGDRPSRLEISRMENPSRLNKAIRSRSMRLRYRSCLSASASRSGAIPPR